MYVDYVEDMCHVNFKDVPYNKWTLGEKIGMIFLGIILIVFIVCGFMATKDYNVEVQANLVDYEFVQQERNLVGFTSTAYNINEPVYDKPYQPDFYRAVYYYEYDGKDYQFTYKSRREPAETMLIWVNSEVPDNYVLDSVKFEASDLLPGFD